MDHDTVEQMVEAVLAVKTDDKWFSKAQKTLAHGSPVSVKLIHEQLARAKHMSLAEVFQFELSLSVQCCRHREFPEGVRALLVDKDGQPSWTYPRRGLGRTCLYTRTAGPRLGDQPAGRPQITPNALSTTR